MDKLDVIDAPTLCSLLGVTDRTLRNWVSDLGCPSNKDGRTRTYSWPDVLSWYVGYASAKQNGVAGDFTGEDDATEDGENLTQANLRKTKAEADLKQIILAERRRQVIGIEDARTRLNRMLGNLRTNLLNMAPKLATRLAGERDPIAQETVIREEMEALCRELATGKIVRSDDPVIETEVEQLDDLQAAAETSMPIDVDEAVVEFLLAHAAVQAAQE